MKYYNYSILLSVVLLLSFSAVGQPGMNRIDESVIRKFVPVSLDEIAIPEYDFQRANKLPLTGYFEKSFDINGTKRTAKFYIADSAPIRSFFTVIAVPENIETTKFLVASGWHSIVDKNEEGLVILEPGKNGWGTVENEQNYIKAVMDFHKRNDYYSIFGINYLVGYGEGGTALEAWSVKNPLLVVSQAFVNSKSQSEAFYSGAKEKNMDGHSSGYVPVEIPNDIKFSMDEIPVPTAFINFNLENVSNGISYWKTVNDVAPESTTGPEYLFGADVFSQAGNSDAWATAYTGPISKVITLEKEVDVFSPQLTQKLYDFVTEYVSYDNSTAYGNFLAPRKEYGEIKTMLVESELREFQIYIPESAKNIWPEGAPVIFIFAGNSQTDKIFFHNTLWWKVADKEGIILVIPCETYSSSSTSVSHANTGMFYEKLAKYITKYYPVDITRFYGTGQSAGSFATQGFGVTNPEYFAAIASTSGLSYPSDEGGFGRTPTAEATFKMIPNYCIIGEGDIEMMTGTLWDESENMLDGWAAYFLKANKVEPLGDGSNVEIDGRFSTWTWTNEQGFPLFKAGITKYRAHNCIPAEMPRLWDFMKHWSYKNGVRYYDGVEVE